MSDSSVSVSESSEDPPSATSPHEALEPAMTTEPDPLDEYQNFIEPDGNRSPEYGAEGLVTLWNQSYGDGSTSSLAEMVPDFDVVVVHGLHGARRPPWMNPGSGDSAWFTRSGFQDGRRVMSFGYDSSKILAGSHTRQAIRIAAHSLLDDLEAKRHGPDSASRSIMFIAHDIGGIIVKDALTIAGLNPRQYSNIFDYTRVLIFYGCPHRSVDYADMEDRLSRFIFTHAGETRTKLPAAIASIRGVARAVADINNLFIDLKHTFRSYVISVFADAANSSIDQAFDSFAGTLAIPFEIRLAGGVSFSEDGNTIEKCLIRIQHQIVVNAGTLAYERVLLSVAAPSAPLVTADKKDHPFAWIGENEKYKSWFNQKKPQLLYVHGRSGVREASEYIFFDLDKIHLRRNNEIVFHFTFDDSDIRHNTIQDMLTCFLAQIIGHFPSLAEFVNSQFERLSLDRSWNDFDLLNWFEYYRLRGEVDGISCVINHFDRCDTVSRTAFLNLFSYIAGVHERPWRVVVTSHERGALLDELSEHPVLDLDAAMPSAGVPESMLPSQGGQSRELRTLLARRPELRCYQERVEKELATIADLDPLAHAIVFEHMSSQDEWPTTLSVESILGPVAEMSVKDIVAKILDNIPDKRFSMGALSWILYSVRPLTIWELSTVLLSFSNRDDRNSAFVSPVFVDDVLWKLKAWLSGIVVMEQHQFRIASAGLRNILMSDSNNETGPKYPWEGIAAKSHAVIAKTSLEYLVRQPVRSYLEMVYGESRSSVMDLPTFCDRTNLCDYAIQFWPYHLSRVPAELDPGSQLRAFWESEAVRPWSKAYWAAANPIKRSPEYFESIYPLLAGVGMAGLAEPWRDGDADISAGLVEACLNGCRGVVYELLPRVDHSIEAFRDALITAGSNGGEAVWMDLIDHIKDRHKDFPWPSSLLNRAAWLGLDKVASKLLDLGCAVDPEDSIQMATPLHLVARTGHLRVAKVLLAHKANVNYVGRFGRTALHVTASFGHAQIARLLAENGADVNARDADGVTAVYLASLWGNWTVVEALISLGADPNLGDREDHLELAWYPLMVAAEEKNFECARALLDGKADPNIRGKGGPPLLYAAANGSPELCRLLIERGADPNHPAIEPPILYQMVDMELAASLRLDIIQLLVENRASVDAQHTDGRAALWWACWFNREDMLPVIAYLLEHGADVNRADATGMAPLHIAARKKNVEMARLLLERGADPNPSNGHTTPLMWAAHSEEVTALLLAKGADPNLAVPGEDSPLIRAVWGDKTEVLKLLLEHKADINAVSARMTGSGGDHKYTALAIAVAVKGSEDHIRLLGDAGANINHQIRPGYSLVNAGLRRSGLSALLEFRPDLNVADVRGNTPMHDLLFTTLENIKLLVRGGANMEMANAEGVTPLGSALQKKRSDIARYLLSKGADTNAPSPVYGSPLHIVCRQHDLEMAKALVAAGADVNLAVPGAAGTPLQCAILSSKPLLPPGAGDDGADDGADDAAESIPSSAASEMVEFLLSSGADATSAGGRFGSAVAAAAWNGSAALLGSLIAKGARATVSDAMGRQPIHLAALRGTEYFEAVLGAGGDALARDRSGRTALHWAAQGGKLAVLQRVLQLSENEAVDQPDVGGWTPLCWAAMGTFSKNHRGQLEVVKELLRLGANPNVTARAAHKVVEPAGIAIYHSAHEDVLEQLFDEESWRGWRDKAKKATEAKNEHEEGKKRHHAERQLNEWPSGCSYCLNPIVGFRYMCKTCARYYLCYKCYDSRQDLHGTDHAFEEQGPEYYPLTETSETSSTESSTESDDESESEAEEERSSPGRSHSP